MNQLPCVEAQPGTDLPLAPFETLLQQYRAQPGAFDEAVDANGKLRTAWEPLFRELGSLSVAEIERRTKQAQRQMDFDGVAFNPHDSRGASRPWSLDPVPLVIPQAEWSTVARGLEQRAQLVDLILLDLLGPQTLLHEKVLPPEALFAHPHYFPAYHSLVPRPRKHLQLFAADLARCPNGNWWVTADRARSPFGLGHVLENRLITSRMLPGAFGRCYVQRLAPFFMTLQKTMREYANRYRENPRIAIWSKGPKSRSYFEDAFLARYLGYTLVEGEDLAVRDNRVMLKTLGGLLPVEVLLRRVEDHHCDPAELEVGQNYGVSGLLEVIRSGNVTVSNSIGSSLIESPMLMAFLARVCEHLLGEKLKLPSVATWWCGQPKALKHVLDQLDNLLIRSAFRRQDEAPYHTRLMSKQAKQALIEQIKSTPAMFVGQEEVVHSTAPVWDSNQLHSWSLAIRAFLVSDGDAYATLPGALARVSPDSHVLSHNMSSGEKSQDVWIVGDEPVAATTLLNVAVGHSDLKRASADLPSRAVDNLFWLGRNLERAEQVSRLVRVALQQLTSDEFSATGNDGLVEACRAAKQLTVEIDTPTSRADVAQAIVREVFNLANPHSLSSVVELAYASAVKVRDRIALDSFRIVTKLRELFSQQAPSAKGVAARPSVGELRTTDLLALLDEAITSLNAMSGLASESTTRNQGWRFMDLGRRIERAFQTAFMLRSLLPVQPQTTNLVRALENCLQVCDSFMTYRNRYLASIEAAPVLDLLITDDTNPRSLVFQLRAISEHVDKLPQASVQASMSAEQRIALSQYNTVRLVDVVELSLPDSRGELKPLHRLLTRLIKQLPRLSDAISGRFLIHAGLQRHFASSQANFPTDVAARGKATR